MDGRLSASGSRQQFPCVFLPLIPLSQTHTDTYTDAGRHTNPLAAITAAAVTVSVIIAVASRDDARDHSTGHRDTDAEVIRRVTSYHFKLIFALLSSSRASRFPSCRFALAMGKKRGKISGSFITSDFSRVSRQQLKRSKRERK